MASQFHGIKLHIIQIFDKADSLCLFGNLMKWDIAYLFREGEISCAMDRSLVSWIIRQKCQKRVRYLTARADLSCFLCWRGIKLCSLNCRAQVVFNHWKRKQCVSCNYLSSVWDYQKAFRLAEKWVVENEESNYKNRTEK